MLSCLSTTRSEHAGVNLAVPKERNSSFLRPFLPHFAQQLAHSRAAAQRALAQFPSHVSPKSCPSFPLAHAAHKQVKFTVNPRHLFHASQARFSAYGP